MGLQYNLVQHHVTVLKRNALVIAAGERYGMTYFIHPWLESHYTIFEEVARKLNFATET
jgi:hypothetical protein